jgi:SulP family sulfate permease
MTAPLESHRPPPSALPPALQGARRSGQTAGTRSERLFPFLRTAHDYAWAKFRPDLIAGLTTALFTVPQAMAYALIAGFPPALGIATATVASILGAGFGSSEFLINGPTNAISVMLAANAALFATQGDPAHAIVLLTLMIGVVQLLAGMLRVGALTRFVSEPVLTGFTAGAGVYIVINQLPSFLGIEKKAIVPDLWGVVPTHGAVFDLLRLLRSLHGTHVLTLGLALLTFTIVRVLQRFERRLARRLPAAFLAVVVVTLVVWLFGLAEPGAVERVKVVRDIEPLSRHLPRLSLPALDLTYMRALLGPALAIGLMGSVEAIAVGKTLAARAEHAFDASRQLIGEGICNLGVSLVGGFASSGSFSRTAVNYEAGAVTRFSCILSGVLTLLIVLAFAPAANLIPIAALAGTLVHVGLKLVDVARLKALFESTTGDRVVLLTTFGAVLFAEHLENALFLGILVSFYYALRRAEGFKLRVLRETPDGNLREQSEQDPQHVGEVTVLNLQGELFFAAAEELQLELIRLLETSARFIVLRVQEAYNLDATTAAAFVHVAEKARKRGGRLLLCGVRPGMRGTLERAGFLASIGEDALFLADRELLGSTRRAVSYAHSLAAVDRPPEGRGI